MGGEAGDSAGFGGAVELYGRSISWCGNGDERLVVSYYFAIRMNRLGGW